MTPIDKNRPSEAWISALRARFPCEREIERVLTRKLSRRAGVGFAPLGLETLTAGIEALLRAEAIADFAVTAARWLAGGASKLQVAFQLTWQQPGDPVPADGAAPIGSAFLEYRWGGEYYDPRAAAVSNIPTVPVNRRCRARAARRPLR